jgi:hypothetical protein
LLGTEYGQKYVCVSNDSVDQHRLVCTAAGQEIKRDLLQRPAQEEARQKVGLVEDRAAARQNLAEVLAFDIDCAWINFANLTQCPIGEENMPTPRKNKATTRKRIECVAIKVRCQGKIIF